MPKHNYQQSYEHLGLDGNADWDEVKSAYQRLAQDYHPDRQKNGGNPRTKDRFVNINVAYHSLREYHRKHSHMPAANLCREIKSRATPSKTSDQSGWDTNTFYTHVNASEFDAIMKKEAQNNTDPTKKQENSAQRLRYSKIACSVLALVLAVTALGWLLSRLNENQKQIITNRAKQTLSEQVETNPQTAQPGQLLAE